MPDCEACTVQSPATLAVTLVPLPVMVQIVGVSEVKVTGSKVGVADSPVTEVADNGTTVPPSTGVGREANCMVWLSLVTMKLCETGEAAAYCAVPAADA